MLQSKLFCKTIKNKSADGGVSAVDSIFGTPAPNTVVKKTEKTQEELTIEDLLMTLIIMN